MQTGLGGLASAGGRAHVYASGPAAPRSSLWIVAVGGLDELDDEDRAELHAAIDEGLAEADEQEVDAADLIAELRARR